MILIILNKAFTFPEGCVRHRCLDDGKSFRPPKQLTEWLEEAPEALKTGSRSPNLRIFLVKDKQKRPPSPKIFFDLQLEHPNHNRPPAMAIKWGDQKITGIFMLVFFLISPIQNRLNFLGQESAWLRLV